MSDDIKNKKLLYHLTSIRNVPGILRDGLKPRAHLTTFNDVADQQIIEGRRGLSLENYVPFHWFANNPFDGRVQIDHSQEAFVIITVRREFGQRNNWKVIPFHPLATEDIRLLDYKEGFAAIDWETMSRRDYHDANCKSVCMAECLSPTPVASSSFFKVYVQSDDVARQVHDVMKGQNVWVEIDVNEYMFVK
jgi:hypothetical protein